MDNTVDLLQIKIERAKAELPEESRNAIDAVPWKTEILKMRAEKGYSYTQLEDLETETELLLCGLLNPEDYPKELEKRMGIPKPKVDELVNEMNEKIFGKIRQELVKIIERKKTSEPLAPLLTKERGWGEVNKKEEPKTKSPDEILQNLESREELLGKIEAPKGEPLKNSPRVPLGNSILEQKLSGSFQIPPTETDHSLGNLSSEKKPNDVPKVDPYRMPIE